MTSTPWEPPLAGTESEHLLGSLDRLRWTFRWKAGDLDEAGLRQGLPSTTMTLAGLLKHLAAVEEFYSGVRVSGGDLGPPWDTADWDSEPDWEWHSATADSSADLYALYDASVATARSTWSAVIDAEGLDQHVHATGPDSQPLSLRRVLCDLIEEYARHTGHADLLREAVDGRTGEDPPDDWRP